MRIQGALLARTPFGSNSFVPTYIFLKSGCIGSRPLYEVGAPPPREILDPPLFSCVYTDRQKNRNYHKKEPKGNHSLLYCTTGANTIVNCFKINCFIAFSSLSIKINVHNLLLIINYHQLTSINNA